MKSASSRGPDSSKPEASEPNQKDAAKVPKREKRVGLGIDAGGTKIAAGLVTEDGEILAKDKFHTPSTSQDAILDTLYRSAETMLNKHDDLDVVGIGLGLPGFVLDTGTFVYGPNIGLRNAPVSELFEKKFGVKTICDNDANVAAWAEYLYGAGQRCGHMLMVTLGTGVGGGVIINDKLFRGSHGFAAEIGHTTVYLENGRLCGCGQHGCLETEASGTALDRITQDLVNGPGGERYRPYMDFTRVTGQVLERAALDGDVEAAQAIDYYANMIAVGMQSLVQAFDPVKIVVGGGVSQMGETLLLDPIRRHFKRVLSGADHRPEVPIVLARLGELAGIVGAAALVLED